MHCLSSPLVQVLYDGLKTYCAVDGFIHGHLVVCLCTDLQQLHNGLDSCTLCGGEGREKPIKETHTHTLPQLDPGPPFCGLCTTRPLNPTHLCLLPGGLKVKEHVLLSGNKTPSLKHIHSYMYIVTPSLVSMHVHHVVTTMWVQIPPKAIHFL